MKFSENDFSDEDKIVAPLVGAWIEILTSLQKQYNTRVAPLVGAWIEICYHSLASGIVVSLPSCERGLKS